MQEITAPEELPGHPQCPFKIDAPPGWPGHPRRHRRHGRMALRLRERVSRVPHQQAPTGSSTDREDLPTALGRGGVAALTASGAGPAGLADRLKGAPGHLALAAEEAEAAGAETRGPNLALPAILDGHGMPATIEGAIRSGKRAAESLLYPKGCERNRSG